jgi:hypothetical protein
MSIRALNIRNVYEMMNDIPDLVSKEQVLQVSGINLENKYNNKINKVCVIDGPTSDSTMKNVESFNYYSLVVFHSFNYKERKKLCKKDKEDLKIKEIVVPEIYKDAEWINHVRLRNHNLSYDEVCRVLNHMMIWHYSMHKQEAVIVLEGDAMLTEMHTNHMPRNSITCLSSSDYFVPNLNYVCMDEPYAYSIDPFCARALFNTIMENGIIEPLNYMIRIDKFTVNNLKKAIRIQNNY